MGLKNNLMIILKRYLLGVGLSKPDKVEFVAAVVSLRREDAGGGSMWI